MAEKLTIDQQIAVSNRGGRLLVSAAAGSGKTKVLVDRLLSYIMDPVDAANIDDFLIITYTKAAASELRGKIAARISEQIANTPENLHLQRQMQRLYLAKISTVHAFCAEVLREYAYRVDLSVDFRVIDENEALELQNNVLENILEAAYESSADNPDFCEFIDSQGFGRDDRAIPQIILKVYNSAKCHLNPEQWLSWCLNTTVDATITDTSQTIWGKYLIDDLHQYLDYQIAAICQCIHKAESNPLLEKPVAVLKETVSQLLMLKSCDSWDSIVKHKLVHYGTLRFSKKCDDLTLIEQIKAVRNACKSGLSKKLSIFSDSSDQILQDLRRNNRAARGLFSLMNSFISHYDSEKRSRRVLDFGDLEHKTLDLLLGKNRMYATSAAVEIASRYREVLVDEYQDSNSVQDAIFSVLTEPKQNCFMVGDVKQSIYQFRLAEPQIFIDKYTSYVHACNAEPMQGRKVILGKNFRSSHGIISAVNDVFGLCMSTKVGGLAYTEKERLEEGIEHISIQEAEVELYGIDVAEDTYAEEAAFVAERISQLLDGTHMIRDGNVLRPITADDIVILLRSPASVGMQYSNALQMRGIRCVSNAGEDLLRAEEISVLRSFLQIIQNPLQDIHLLAVLTSRVFGFTADDIAKIRSNNKNADLYHALLETPIQKAQSFLDQLSTLRKEARLMNLTQLLQRIISITRFDSIYAAMPDGTLREENIQIFCQLAFEYSSTGHRDLIMFLSYLDSMDEKGLQRAEQTVSGAVTIMSIHKSKGLEFPVVFLCALSRSFNKESIRSQILCDKELGVGMNCVDYEKRIRYPSISKRAISVKMISDTISEELRVLYVAMTRARDRLIMTYAVKNLEKDLKEILWRMDLSQNVLLAMEADCPGEWILQAALKRTEAGAFFQLAGNPMCAMVSDEPWMIKVIQYKTETAIAAEQVSDTVHMNDDDLKLIATSLSHQYPYQSATITPSKMTATQMKGRMKDIEASENSALDRNIKRQFRKPSFMGRKRSGTEYGSMLHLIMQHINFAACTDEAGVRAELDRLCAENLIFEEQISRLNPKTISSLFASELGNKMMECREVLREFKFSILDEAEYYSPDLKGEKVLLQGVIDCALIEDDGITVIDFKTDYATEDTVSEILQRYEGQVKSYVKAMEKIYNKPVKAAYLYLFSIDRYFAV